MFNAARPYPAPTCLSKGKYNTKEVVDLLESMFFGKCYLCEQDALTDPEIEHFDPHENDSVKKYDWDNLYYSCSRCNSIKSNTHKNLIDCCDSSIDAFKSIKCKAPRGPNDDIEVHSLCDNEQVSNTVTLLTECYNNKSTALRAITRSVLAEDILGHFTDFLNHRRVIVDKKSSAANKEAAKGRIEAMLDITFPFSVFWRWHLLDDTKLKAKLEDLINF